MNYIFYYLCIFQVVVAIIDYIWSDGLEPSWFSAVWAITASILYRVSVRMEKK